MERPHHLPWCWGFYPPFSVCPTNIYSFSKNRFRAHAVVLCQTLESQLPTKQVALRTRRLEGQAATVWCASGGTCPLREGVTGSNRTDGRRPGVNGVRQSERGRVTRVCVRAHTHRNVERQPGRNNTHSEIQMQRPTERQRQQFF